MERVKVDTQSDFIPDALGISTERFKQIDLKMKIAIHDLRTPVKGEKCGFGAVEIIEKFAGIAEDEKELSLVMFVAGRYTQKIFGKRF